MPFLPFVKVRSESHLVKQSSRNQEDTRRPSESRPRLWSPKALALSLWAISSTNCSLQDFDALTAGSSSGGHSPASGGATSVATRTAAGTSANAIGGFETGGRGSAGAATALGDAGSAGGPMGGAGNSAGSTSQAIGGTTATFAPIVCPPYVGTGGALVTPPSNDFETNLGSWVRVSGGSGLLSRLEDQTACSGAAYMSSGGFRKGGWDGPSIDLTTYMSPGRSYHVTLAARFSAKTLPPSSRVIELVMITVCDENPPLYTTLSVMTTTSNWVRLQTDPALPITFPLAGCNVMYHAAVYLQTSDADVNLALDADDFRLIDVTPPSVGVGGAGGAGGTTALDFAGNAGAAGSGA